MLTERELDFVPPLYNIMQQGESYYSAFQLRIRHTDTSPPPPTALIRRDRTAPDSSWEHTVLSLYCGASHKTLRPNFIELQGTFVKI